MIYLLSGSVWDNYYASRSSCFSTFFQFIERSSIFGVNVLRGFGTYELIEESRTDPYGVDYYRTATLFLLEINLENMSEFVSRINEFSKFPWTAGDFKVPDNDVALIEFLRECQLSFEDFPNCNPKAQH